MTDRVQQVYALLRSLADWEPRLNISVARGAIRGESPGRLVDCPHCEGTGCRGNSGFRCRFCRGRRRVPIDPQTGHVVADEATTVEQLVRRKRTVCSGCGGSGKRTASTARDPGLRDVWEVDPHTGRRYWVRRERETCPFCAGTGSRETIEMARPPRSLQMLDGEDILDWLIRKRHERDREGSYAELEQRLRLLEVTHPWARLLLERYVINPIGSVVSARVAAKIDWAVRWIEPGMPYPIRVPEQAMRTAVVVPARTRSNGVEKRRRDRDSEIRALNAAGASGVQLAAQYGLSRGRISQIVGDEDRAATATGPAA